MLIHNQVIRSKIFDLSSQDTFQKRLNYWRFKDKKLVFTNGCFDVLHLGHIDYLSKAAELGNILIIGLNTDASVRAIKGQDRPINPQHARATLLASLFFVDAVVMFDEQTPLSLITTVQPDVLVKGSDYREKDIVGYDLVKAKDGKVIVVDLLESYSTTNIIQKMTSLHGTDPK